MVSLASVLMTEPALSERADLAGYWVQRFLNDLAVVRSANTVRAYAFDLRRWGRFCEQLEIDPFRARPRTAIEFIRVERERSHRESRCLRGHVGRCAGPRARESPCTVHPGARRRRRPAFSVCSLWRRPLKPPAPVSSWTRFRRASSTR